MDIGSIVSWIQLGLWVFAVLFYLIRVFRGEIKMHPLMKKIASSNGLIGLVILLGLAMSAISVYMTYSVYVIPRSIVLNISAYSPSDPIPMRVVTDQHFEDQDVPLDGYTYERCTFKNICFLYDGGAYGLHNSTATEKWKVCVRDQRITNYFELMNALRLLHPKRAESTKTVLVPGPAPSNR